MNLGEEIARSKVDKSSREILKFELDRLTDNLAAETQRREIAESNLAIATEKVRRFHRVFPDGFMGISSSSRSKYWRR